jgi:hypothetical protein
MLPNRIAVYLTGLIALALGLLPLVGNLDWTSTAGIIGAIAAISVVVREWLVNWGKWERGEGEGVLPGIADDEFNEEQAQIPESAKEAATHIPEK